jgi:hypothetical protein
MFFTEDTIRKLPTGSMLHIMATEKRGTPYKELIEKQLSILSPTSAKKIQNHLLSDHANTWQWLHELAIGYLLASKRFNPMYEEQVMGRTPDWLLQMNNSRIIVEVVSLNPPRAITDRLDQLASQGGGAFAMWETELPNEKRRPSDAIRNKSEACKPFVENGIAAIVAVFSNGLNTINGSDAYHLLVTGEDADGKLAKDELGGLFMHDASRLSGVLWLSGDYIPTSIDLILNLNAPITLPTEFTSAF